MTNCSYSHLYLRLKDIFKSEESSTFANLLMEKPSN